MAVNKHFSAQARKHGKWLAIAFFGIIAFAMLFDTVSFLVTRPLIRDTLLSLGLGERIEDARVTVDSCTTSGHWVYPRRSASYLAYDTDCEITIYVPAKLPYRQIERSQVRLWAPDDGKTVLGAGQVMGQLGARWPGDVLWRMWREVPNIFLIVFGLLAAAVIFAVWRWRRWWRHDRFRRRKRF